MIARRNLLAAAPAVAIAGVMPSAVAAAIPHPDAELIALGDALRTSWAAQESLPDDDEDALDAAYDKSEAIVREIEGLTATTIEGVKVKVLAIWWCRCGEDFTDESFSFTGEASTDQRLVSELLNDILAMA